MLSDEELARTVAAAGRGDRDAFVALVQATEGMVSAVVTRIIEDVHVAEEVIQDVYVDAYRALPAWRPDGADPRAERACLRRGGGCALRLRQVFHPGANITELPGLVVISQTPEAHDDVAQLLDTLRQVAGELVCVEARYYALGREEVGGVLRGEELLDSAGRLRLEKAGRLLHEVSTMGFNSQRFSAHSGGATEYIRGYDVEVAQSASCFDPIVRTVLEGMQLDVRPVLGPENEHATLQLRVHVTALDAHIARVDASHAATTATAQESGSSVLAMNGPATMGLGSVAQKPELELDELRTYTRIPIGMGRVFLRSSRLVGKDEIAVLLVTARLSR